MFLSCDLGDWFEAFDLVFDGLGLLGESLAAGAFVKFGLTIKKKSVINNKLFLDTYFLEWSVSAKLLTPMTIATMFSSLARSTPVTMP